MVSPIIKHHFHSEKGDQLDSTFVRPSDWNKEHDMTVSGPSVLGATEAGPVVELPLVLGTPPDDGTIWTADKIQEAIDAAIAAIAPTLQTPVGTIVASITGTMPGYLPLDGNSFGNVGSGGFREDALYQTLYETLWGAVPTLTVEGGRGATGNADWLAGKFMVLPQSGGTVLGAYGVGLSNNLLDIVGADTHTLNEAQIPDHAHNIEISNAGGGSVGGGSVMQQTPGSVGSGTTRTGGSQAHNNIQRTMIIHTFWIKY